MAGEAVEKAFGLKPSDPVAGWGSGMKCGGADGLGLSVMVLDEDACEGDDEGRGAAGGRLSVGGCGGGEGEDGSSSGFAMRSPPRDCERLRSPFIMAAAGQRRWEVSEGRVAASGRGSPAISRDDCGTGCYSSCVVA